MEYQITFISLSLLFGAILQGFLLVRKWQFITSTLSAIAIGSVIGISKYSEIENETEYAAIFVLIFFLYISSIFSLFGRDLTIKLSEKTLLQSLIIVAFIFLTLGAPSKFILNFYILTGLFVLALSFIKIKVSKVVKILLYIWFSFTSLYIFAFQSQGITSYFEMIINDQSLINSFNFDYFIHLVFLGMAVLPITINLVLVILLVPLPSKRIPYEERIRQVKQHISLLDQSYDHIELLRYQAILVILLQGGVLLLNHELNFMPDFVAISLSYLIIEASVFLKFDLWLILINLRNFLMFKK